MTCKNTCKVDQLSVTKDRTIHAPPAYYDCDLHVPQDGENGRESWVYDGNGDVQRNGHPVQSDTQALRGMRECQIADVQNWRLVAGYSETPFGSGCVYGCVQGKVGGDARRKQENANASRLDHVSIGNESDDVYLESANDYASDRERPDYQLHEHEALLHENANVHPSKRISHGSMHRSYKYSHMMVMMPPHSEHSKQVNTQPQCTDQKQLICTHFWWI